MWIKRTCWELVGQTPNIVPKKVFEAMLQHEKITRDYSSLTLEAEISLQSQYPMTPIEYLRSIRNALMKQKVINAYGRMQKELRSLTRQYANRDITHIARERDFAPLNLLRSILTQQYKQAVIYTAFVEGKPEVLRPRDRAQYALAAAADAESEWTQAEILERAESREAEFVESIAWIPHRTQAELVEEQKRLHGRAINTPDVLFIEPIIVNGKPVMWIDYKDYVGVDVKFLIESNRKQCARYVAEWGPGALCYLAHVEGLEVLEDVQLLSRDMFMTARRASM